MRPLCFCGCGARAVHRHHAITRAEIKRWGGLIDDPRVLVDAGHTCHFNHHAASKPYRLASLPDSVYAFASELMGPGPSYEWLKRHYSGDDPRLDALLKAWEQAA